MITEYAIAFLGSIEAGLVVTTINPWYTCEEISRQLISSQPKAIFCLIDHFDVVKKACLIAHQPDIKVIAIKNELSHSFRSDMINFTELMNPKGKQRFFFNERIIIVGAIDNDLVITSFSLLFKD